MEEKYVIEIYHPLVEMKPIVVDKQGKSIFLDDIHLCCLGELCNIGVEATNGDVYIIGREILKEGIIKIRKIN
nr:MAG TPA: hypothetical protein [Caudoviricetes sp.]